MNNHIKALYKEYYSRIDAIHDEYGEKDGFIIEGKLWWDYYKELIDGILNSISRNEFTLEQATDFYKVFGFGPKLYNRTFVENGIEPICKLIKFLANKNISSEEKLYQIVEDPGSEHFFKGVGVNFVTLFLTSYFPDRYVQWNQQTDTALKMLDLYPERERGEKKSSRYTKINEICTKLMNETEAESLTVMDNFLYCVAKGYIGNMKMGSKGIDKEIEKIESVEPVKKTGEHLEMMYMLVKIGINKGYDVFVAINDKRKVFKNEVLSELTLSEIPIFSNPEVVSIAKYIDVIWFKKRSNHPVRFFEIENSTSIYSGLLRFNDIKIDYPMVKATIVIPEKKEKAYDRQIERRTFKFSELSDICDALTYDRVREWYQAVEIDSEFN